MEIRDKLRGDKPHLTKTYHVKEIGLFGSCALGTMKRHSDVDVLVEFEEGHSDLFNYMRLKLHLQALLGRKVDLVIRKAIKPGLKDRILDHVSYV